MIIDLGKHSPLPDQPYDQVEWELGVVRIMSPSMPIVPVDCKSCLLL